MILRFDEFRIDTDRFELSGPEGVIEAEPQVLEFLIHLARRRGELVTKDELHEAFWPGRFVSDAALSTLVRNARRLIGDSGSAQKYIETRHGRGFRFRADVEEVNGADQGPLAPRVRGAPAVAVLPFETLSGAAFDTALAQSVRKEIVTALTRFRWFPLVAQNAVASFMARPADSRSPCAHMGAAYVIEGDVLHDGETVRVHVQLNDAVDCRQFWADRRDFRFEGLIGLLDDVARFVVGAIQPELVERERLKAQDTPEAARDAWQLFVIAQNLLACPDKDDNARARDLLERAQVLEPHSGRVWAGLAMTHFWDHKYGWSESGELSLGTAAQMAGRAVQLAPDDSWAWTALGICKLSLRDHDGAIADCRRAIRVNPTAAMAYGGLSWVLAYSGEFEEALATFEKARALAPNDRRIGFWLTGKGVAEFCLGRDGAALETAKLMAQLSPANPSAHRMHAATAARLGRMEEARREAARLLDLLPEHDVEAEVARQSFRDPVHARAYADALRLAGLGAARSRARGGRLRDVARGWAPRLPQQLRETRTADGVRIAWSEIGEGPPLMKTANWLNHLELDHASPLWGPTIERYATGRRLIRYDSRGMGLSDRSVARYDLDALVSDIEAVVEAAGLDRFPVLGMSQGCALAIEFTRRHPDRVTALVLIGGFARGWRHPDWGRDTDKVAAVATLARLGWENDDPAYRRIFSQSVMPGAAPDDLAWLDEFMRQTVSAEAAAAMLEGVGDIDVSGALRAISQPSLVLHASRDASVPIRHGRALAERLTNARFVELDSENHVITRNEAAWTVMMDEIDRFLRETGCGLAAR